MLTSAPLISRTRLTVRSIDSRTALEPACTAKEARRTDFPNMLPHRCPPHTQPLPIRSAGLNRSWARAAFSAS